MVTCYICEEEISQINESKEHIIPNAIGGRLKSKKLLCKECNNSFGDDYDASLVKQINLTTLLNIRRERNPITPDIRGFTKSGKTFDLTHELVPKEVKPPVIIKGDKITYNFRNMAEAKKVIKKLKRKNPKIDSEKLLNSITWKEEYVDEKIFFDFELIEGESAFKAIAKIALNYYIHSGGDKEFVEYSLLFLQNKLAGNYNNLVCHYYEANGVLHTLGKEEISHILYLRGNPSDKSLYCYIELFNTHCFLVVLNRYYYGPFIENTYCYDVLKRVQFSKEVKLKLNNKDLDKLKFPTGIGKDSIELFHSKECRILDIVGIEYEVVARENAKFRSHNGYSKRL